MSLVAGVDSHKESLAVVVIDSVGKELDRFTIENGTAHFEATLKRVRRLGKAVWGIEGTGAYGRLFADYLVAAKMVVYEVPGRLTKRHRAFGTRSGKSDPIDARAIAEAVLRERERLGRYYGDDIHEELRLHYDHRDQLVHDRVQAINRLRTAVFRLQLGALPRDCYREKALRLVEFRSRKIKAFSLVVAAVLKELEFAIAAIRLYNEQIGEVELAIRPLANKFTGLLGVTGVSSIVVAGIVGHAGDVRNIRNADAFAMRTGAAPLPCSSGKSDRMRLNKGGNRQLNRILHTMAVVQRRIANHPGQEYYRKKLGEGKSPTAALRSLKRRLATIVFYRLVDDYAAFADAKRARAA
jgi:transposase